MMVQIMSGMQSEVGLSEVFRQVELAHTTGVYSKRPVVIVRGQGARLWDADGREYIDCVGGTWGGECRPCQSGCGTGDCRTGADAHQLPGVIF